jgi:hypothetical protein
MLPFALPFLVWLLCLFFLLTARRTKEVTTKVKFWLENEKKK